jgi:hypothetical protein
MGADPVMVAAAPKVDLKVMWMNVENIFEIEL